MKTSSLKNAIRLAILCMLITMTSCENANGPQSFTGEDNNYTSTAKILGYCGENIDVTLGAGQMATLGAATTLPMPKFGDSKQIVGARVYIGAAASNTKIFITKDLVENVFEQYFDVVPNSWNYVKFDKPFDIDPTDAGYYIGYIGESDGSMLAMESGDFVINSKNYPMDIYFDSTEDTQWKFFTEVANFGFQGKLAVQAIIAGGNYEQEIQNDISIENVRADKKLLCKNENIIKFDICNFGVKTVNRVLVNYTYNGKKNNIFLSEMDLWNGESKTITIKETTPNKAGQFPMTINIRAEGIIDEIAEDNETIIDQEVLSSGFARKVLLEKFTGMSCSACPNGAEVVRKARSAFEGRTIEVAHHEGWMEDPLTIEESKEYLWFYNRNKFAPAIMVDRDVKYSSNKESAVGNIADGPTHIFTDKVIEQALASMSPINVNIDHSYNDETREIKITVSGETINELPNARLNVWLTQSNIIAPQTSGGENYRHDFAIRKSLTGAWGEKIEFKDNKFTANFEYNLPKEIGNEKYKDSKFKVKPEDINIVAFVADYDANDNLNCKVHNANEAKLIK